MPDDPAVAHSTRFRKVSSAYPFMVTDAYGGDMVEAMADGDGLVAARVAEWERSQGLEPPRLGRHRTRRAGPDDLVT